MNDCLVNSQNIFSVACPIAVMLIGMCYISLKIGHKRDYCKEIPVWWEKIVFPILVLIILGIFFLAPNDTGLDNCETEQFLTEEKTRKLLEMDGNLVVELMMNEINPKLEELTKIKYSKVDVHRDFALLNGRLLAIFETSKIRLGNLNERFPNGDLLSEVISKTYKADEFNKAFLEISIKLFENKSSITEQSKSVKAFIKRRQYALIEKIIDDSFP